MLGRFAFGTCPVCTPFSRSDGEVVDVELASALRAVMRVLTTQIGFVQRTVAEPARAPANMDSTVVRRRDRRPEARARRSKKERDHSYPGGEVSRDVAMVVGELRELHGVLLIVRPKLLIVEDARVRIEAILTVVVDKVCDSNAKQRAVQSTEKSTHALGINNLLNRLKR